MKRSGTRGLGLVALLALAQAGCLSEMDKYFAAKGLNRLPFLKEGVEPGCLVGVKDGKAFIGDRLVSWARSPDVKLRLRESRTVFGAEQRQRTMDASAAGKLIDLLFPIAISPELKLQGTVEIQQITADSLEVESRDVAELLKDEGVREWVLEHQKRGIKPYVLIATYDTNQLHIKSTSDTQISASVEVGEVKLIEKGGVGFKLGRSQKTTLDVSGDTYYTFAVKACAVDLRKVNGAMVIGKLGVDCSDKTTGKALTALGQPASPSLPEITFSSKPLQAIE